MANVTMMARFVGLPNDDPREEVTAGGVAPASTQRTEPAEEGGLEPQTREGPHPLATGPAPIERFIFQSWALPFGRFPKPLRARPGERHSQGGRQRNRTPDPCGPALLSRQARSRERLVFQGGSWWPYGAARASTQHSAADTTQLHDALYRTHRRAGRGERNRTSRVLYPKQAVDH